LLLFCVLCLLFFFFQAEDGIRDATVTGVQTCALPICIPRNTCRVYRARRGGTSFSACESPAHMSKSSLGGLPFGSTSSNVTITRSEERRVGKECRSER